MKIRIYALIAAVVFVAGAAIVHSTGPVSKATSAIDPGAEKLAPYHARFGRHRPVIAVVGDNAGTEVTDFFIPYSVLARSDAAEVLSVSTRPGAVRMMPALMIEAQATTAAFDARFPDGADYLIVPAVHDRDNPALLDWIAAQAAKGATVIGICDGVLTLGNAGLLKGHRATGHWFTQGTREKDFPDTQWLKNVRYVADGRIVTTSGVTAAIPASLALVEAIAGRERAAAVANALGVTDWTPFHNSDVFRFDASSVYAAAHNLLAFWLHEEIGVPVSHGIDEIALALTADAYSRTYRTQALSIAQSKDPIRTLHGLSVLPDQTFGGSNPPDRMLLSPDTGPAALALERALSAIANTYGSTTAAFVALQLEYQRPQKDVQPINWTARSHSAVAPAVE